MCLFVIAEITLCNKVLQTVPNIFKFHNAAGPKQTNEKKATTRRDTKCNSLLNFELAFKSAFLPTKKCYLLSMHALFTYTISN